MDVLRLGLGYGLSAATEVDLLPIAFGGELLKKISAADCLLGTTEFLRLEPQLETFVSFGLPTDEDATFADKMLSLGFTTTDALKFY